MTLSNRHVRALAVLDDAHVEARLDAVTGDAGARLYERMGWVRVGTIPGYALFPDGRPCATTYYYRELER